MRPVLIRPACVAFSLCVPHAAFAQPGHAPKATDITATSLARVQPEWTVISTITLGVVDDESSEWTFSLVHPASLTENGRLRVTCADPANPEIDLDKKIKQTTLPCRYQPPVGFVGDETFQYVVSNATSISHPATVTVTVKSQGLRWEFVTNAGTTLTSDNPITGIPDVIGKTVQDFMFNLDWEIADPRITANALASTGSSLDAVRRQVTPAPKVTLTRSAHFAFHTGIVSKPQAVQASQAISISTQPSTQQSPSNGVASTPAGSLPVVAAQRTFTVGGEFNYNAVLPSDAGGTYLELGALGKGFLDASLEGATTTEEVAGQVLRLLRTTGTGTFRGEVGLRAALKQYHDDLHTAVIRSDGQIVFPKNSENFITFEAAYQRNTGLEGLSAAGSTQDRYVIRVTATPEIPNVTGHVKGLIGIELNGDFRGHSPRQITILYGVNLTAIGLGR